MGESQVEAPLSGATDRRRRPIKYHLMAIVEYDGTQYLGFQVQGPAAAGRRSGRTVQGEIESALAAVAQRAVRIVAAGRTDAGVHASGQVIHLDVVWGHALPDLQRALNAVLPRDIALRELREAPPSFHARYSARSREYAYTIWNAPVRSPLHERYAQHCQRPLDAEAMDRACQCLVGTHDFLPFGWPPHGDNTVRTVFRARCRREGEQVLVEIEADAFLRSMVRRIVGNLILVGYGDLSVEGFADLLSLRHRRLPAVAAPAQGLTLVRVRY